MATVPLSCNPRSCLFFLGICLLMALPGSVHAAVVVQWDFSKLSGSYSGTVSPGNQEDPGNVTGSIWNAVNGFSGVGTGYLDQNGDALPDVTLQFAINGSAEMVTLTGSSAWGGYPPLGYGESNTPASAIYDTSLAKDYIYTYTGGILGVRVSGLAAGVYDIYVPTIETVVTNRTRTVGIGTGVAYTQFGDAEVIGSGTAGSATTWIEGVNYAFKEVSITGPSDYIDVFVTKNGSDNSPSINGLQIVAVPEPRTWALATLGFMALIIFRARRKPVF